MSIKATAVGNAAPSVKQVSAIRPVSQKETGANFNAANNTKRKVNQRPQKTGDAADTVSISSGPKIESVPLTADELRGMDGQPVWVVGVSSVNNFEGHWDICGWTDGNLLLSRCGEAPAMCLYGITWRAYRQKPEE